MGKFKETRSLFGQELRLSDIARILEIIHEHRDSIAADFRQFFGISLGEVGDSISWEETYSLLKALADDTTSRTAVSIHKLAYRFDSALPFQIMQLETFIQANSKKKVKKIPRPWEKELKTNAIKAKALPAEKFKKLMSMFGGVK